MSKLLDCFMEMLDNNHSEYSRTSDADMILRNPDLTLIINVRNAVIAVRRAEARRDRLFQQLTGLESKVQL